MSFLSCPSSPAKHMNQNERKHELKQRIEEKDRKVKEFELQKHKELKDKFKYVRCTRAHEEDKVCYI